MLTYVQVKCSSRRPPRDHGDEQKPVIMCVWCVLLFFVCLLLHLCEIEKPQNESCVFSNKNSTMNKLGNMPVSVLQKGEMERLRSLPKVTEHECKEWSWVLTCPFPNRKMLPYPPPKCVALNRCKFLLCQINEP